VTAVEDADGLYELSHTPSPRSQRTSRVRRLRRSICPRAAPAVVSRSVRYGSCVWPV